MTVTDTANKLRSKAVDLRKEADHLDSLANELDIVADEQFSESTDNKREAFEKLGKTPLPEVEAELHKKKKQTRYLSPAARRRIAKAQRLRWARWKAKRGEKVLKMPKSA